jgi:hypothetical protein
MLPYIVAAVLFLAHLPGVQALTIPARSVIERQDVTEAEEWQEYHALAYSEYAEAFTALYEGLETRWSKNGRLMIRQGSSGPYKFVKRAV